MGPVSTAPPNCPVTEAELTGCLEDSSSSHELCFNQRHKAQARKVSLSFSHPSSRTYLAIQVSNVSPYLPLTPDLDQHHAPYTATRPREPISTAAGQCFQET